MKRLFIFFTFILLNRYLSSVEAEPIILSTACSSCVQTICVEKEGEGELVITASAPGTDWEIPGAESAVLTLYHDDEYNQDIILFKGAEPFNYSVGLGNLSAGEHQLKFIFTQEKSSKKATQILIDTYTIILHTSDENDYAVWQYSPLFYGRDVNYHSDVPLLMWYTRWVDEEELTHIQYSVIWSNEDGGTDTPGLMARWGRTTDIEWIYEIVLDKDGEIQQEKYQGAKHKHKDFSGEKLGNHPVLAVVSDNNVMGEGGESDYLFFLSPGRVMPEEFGRVAAESQPREVIMDANPWTYQIMAKELKRENKVEKKPDPKTLDVSDPKNYVFIGYRVELTEEDKVQYHKYYISNSIENVQFAVRFKDDTNWYLNDHAGAVKKINRDGWARTTIEVPDGQRQEEIRELKITLVPLRKNFQLTLTDISTVFMLAENYLPQKSIFSWHGSLTLNQDNPSKTWHIH